MIRYPAEIYQTYSIRKSSCFPDLSLFSLLRSTYRIAAFCFYAEKEYILQLLLLPTLIQINDRVYLLVLYFRFNILNMHSAQPMSKKVIHILMNDLISSTHPKYKKILRIRGIKTRYLSAICTHLLHFFIIN